MCPNLVGGSLLESLGYLKTPSKRAWGVLESWTLGQGNHGVQSHHQSQIYVPRGKLTEN